MPAQNLPGLMLDYAHPLSRGMVGWWPMNEGGGERLNDITGLNPPAVLTGVSPSATSGWRGVPASPGPNSRAINIDGTDDKILITRTTQTQSAPCMTVWLTNEWTYNGWHTISNLAGYAFLAARTDNPGYPHPLQIYWEPVGGYFISLIGNGSVYSGLAGATGLPIVANRWFNLTVTRSGTSGIMALNGKVFGVSGAYSQPATDGTNNLTFGMRETSYGGQGATSNVRLYNRALSASEVAQLYADPLAGALAPSNPRRYFVGVTVSPPAAIAAPPTADRLWNRGYAGRIFRRGEKGS